MTNGNRVNEYLDDYADKVSTTISDFITSIIRHATPKGTESSDYKFAISIHDLKDDKLAHVVTRNGRAVGTVRYEDGRITATCDCRPML